jgi:anti-sigma factor RsiW
MTSVATKREDDRGEDERAILLVHAYVDGELDPATMIEIEQRMAVEPKLAAERARVEALRRTLHERLPQLASPPGLEARVRRATGVTIARARPTRPTWLALAASVMLAIFASSGGTWYALQPSGGNATAEAVISSHLRALMAPQPIDVMSSDRHTVKPWFNGRIPQAPRVIDLAQDGFPLIGGRVDVVGHTPVPSLVYRHDKHLISLTAIPDASAAVSRSQAVRGYNMIAWTTDGVTYWAVSDLNVSELETFARLFRDAPA